MKRYKWFNYNLHLEVEFLEVRLCGFHIFNITFCLKCMSIKYVLRATKIPFV